MSSPHYVTPLEVEIRPSRLIAALLFAIHITAALVCVQLPLAPLSRLVLLLAIIGSLLWNIVLFWQRTPRRLRWSLEDGWRIVDFRGNHHTVELMPMAHLGGWFVLAHFKAASGKRSTVMLARDSCNSDSMRRLRILLKYGAPKG